MKINYINLKKKLVNIKQNIKNGKSHSEKDNEETKYIGINYSKKDKNNVKKVFSNLKSAPKGSYTLIIFMIMLLVVTTKLNLDTYSKVNSENFDTYKLEDEQTAEVNNNNVIIYKEAVSSVFDRNEDYEKIVETTSNNILDSNKDIIEDEKYVYEYSYIRPVIGETLKEYSMDKVIYSKTLDMWKVHDGIDIYANIGEEVKAVEKGIIERIYEDAFYGHSVIINHKNGIKTIYRNLENRFNIKEKQEIEKGCVIGYVGNSANYECKDEPHLHFEVLQNLEITNPIIIGIK